MDQVTIVAMLLASLLHASWHALVKSSGDQLAVLCGMCLVSAAMAAAALPFVSPPPVAVWPVLAVSVVLHSCYRASLARAYAYGELGHAYALARGTTPLFATLIGVWLLQQVPSLSELIGIAMIATGVVTLASHRIAGVHSRFLLAVFLVGLTVAGYSAVDAYGIRMSGDWLGFTAWLIALDSGGFLLLMYLIRRQQLWLDLSLIRTRGLLAGVIGMVSFCVFMWALGRAPVGLVSSLRETSILFAGLIGIIFYRETLSPRLIVGIAGIFVGLVSMVALH